MKIGYLGTRQHRISAEACNTVTIKHLNRFFGYNYVTNITRFENFVSRISTPELKANE